MKVVSAVVCLLAMFQIATGQADKAVIEQLKRLDSEIDQAFLRGDRKFFESRLANDVVVLNGEGEVAARKAEMLSQLNSPPPNIKRTIAAKDVQVFLSGSTAIVNSKKTSTYETDQGSSTDSYRETNTYTLVRGHWLLASSWASYGPPPYAAKDVRFDIPVDDAMMKGNKDATVVIIEFTDYECPLCRKFAAETFDQIETHYIKTGNVGFVARNLPVEEIHPLAFGAAKAAQCAALQGRFWEMNKRLLQQPLKLTPKDLVEHAKTLELDLSKFAPCLDDQVTADAIRKEMSEAKKIGISGTPIFLIGVKKPSSPSVKVVRMISGAYPYEVFKATLDSVITAQNR